MSDPSPSRADFEVVDNQYTDRDYDVKISIPEFTCVSPRTGQPDFAIIEIIYIPNKLIEWVRLGTTLATNAFL